MDKISRPDAKAKGLQRYFNGKACPQGHVAERYVSTYQCVDCIAQQAPAWAKANPDETADISRRYRKANPGKVKAWKSADQKRQSPALLARKRRYVEANRDKVNARTKAWELAHPDLCAAKSARYQASKKRRCPAWANHDAINLVYIAAHFRRALGEDVEVDHIIPLQGRKVSGLHVHTNLQIIPRLDNKVKSNRF